MKAEDLIDASISVPLPVAQRLIEQCSSATSKLDCLVMRDESLPPGYAKTVKESFDALGELRDAIIAS